MPFDENHFEYAEKNSLSQRRELFADSRYKIIRKRDKNIKFQKWISCFLIVSTLFFLLLQIGVITPMTIH